MQESKYFYNGIPLSKYCKDNGINMSTIRARIWEKKQSKKYGNYSEQEIVDTVIDTYGSAVKYMYKGVTLRQYCLDNGINLGTIDSRIRSIRKTNRNLSNDELVILAMEKFDNQNFRFFYKGIPLKEYCKEHPEVNYNTIRSYINTEKRKHPELSDEELIEQYLDKEHKGCYRYYYLGIPLKEYCDENNLNYKNIIAYIGNYKKNDGFKNLTDDELVEVIMDKYQPFKPKYLYKGLTLREYCNKNNLSYYSVVSFVKRKLANGSTKSVDNLIDEGVKTINRYGIIYYYKGMPLKDYAKQNNFNIESIRCAILRKQLNSDKAIQEIVDECVQAYQEFSIKHNYTKKINETFDKLRSKKVQDINEIKDICNFLKIDFANVNTLVSMNFSYNQAISMIWYFYDGKTNNDYKIITNHKISDVFLLIDKLKKSDVNMEKFELYDLIGIYKSELYDSKKEILLRQKRYIYKTMYSLCTDYGVKINNSNYKDFEGELRCYLLIAINNSNLNIYGQIVKYMDLTVKGYFRTYLKKYIKHNDCLSLNDSKYSSDKNTRSEKAMIDYITYSNNPYKTKKNDSFSSDMMKILSSLSPIELSFIMLKYQEKYSDDELADYFKLSLDEIKQKEIGILSSLRKNDNVKKLRK